MAINSGRMFVSGRGEKTAETRGSSGGYQELYYVAAEVY